MRFALLALVAAAAGCTAPAPEGSINADLTRDEARAMAGKQDGLDICDWLGWYGDGICDEFCVNPDPDCEAQCVEDLDCPQPQCLPGGPCPSFICDAGECVREPEPACVVGGCSGQLCYDPSQGGGISTCEFLPEYACYDTATCERQPTGECGWTPTPELTQCIDDARGDPSHCGGFAGFTCAEGEFCNYGIENGCGFADQMGTCEALPQVCPEIYSPVCGCDGETYSNECDANAAGVSIFREGACEPETCGDTVCGEGENCQYCWGSFACVPDGALC